MKLNHAILAEFLSLVVFLLANCEAQTKPCVGQISTMKQLEPASDVDLLLMYEPFPFRYPDAIPKILDRCKSDRRGFFELNIPLDVDICEGAIRILQLPDRTYSAALHDFTDRNDLGIKLRHQERFRLFTKNRHVTNLSIKDEFGRPVQGARILQWGFDGSEILKGYLRSIPELEIPLSDHEGKITLDNFYLNTGAKIVIEHRDFATHRCECSELYRDARDRELEVTLGKGNAVKFITNDLRLKRPQSKLAIGILNQSFLLEPNTPTFLNVDWNDSDRLSLELLNGSDGNVNRDIHSTQPFFLSRQTDEVNVSVCTSEVLRGFARDKQSGRPLGNRKIYVHTGEAERFHVESQTQHDGYFQLAAPKVNGELIVALRDCGGFSDDTVLRVPGEHFPQVLMIEGNVSEANRINVVQSSPPSEWVVFQNGKYANGTFVVSQDNWFEYDSQSNSFGGSTLMSMTSPMAATATESANTIELAKEIVAIGSILTDTVKPVAWANPKLSAQGAVPWDKRVNASSMGRFVFSGLLPNKAYLIEPDVLSAKQAEFDVEDQSIDLEDFVLTKPNPHLSESAVPRPTFHVDEWIHGSPVDLRVGLDRPLLVVMARPRFVDKDRFVDRLHLLRKAYPPSDLNIVLILLLEKPINNAVKAELLLRKCEFSVGIDRNGKSLSMLPDIPILFRPKTNEAILVPALLRDVRDAMLYLNDGGSK